MQRVSRSHTIPGYRRTETLEPAATVELGESFIVETITFRTPIVRTVEDANPKNYREREETGPVFVKGVKPGDYLAIHIEHIRPEGHATGACADDPGFNPLLRIEHGRVHFPGGMSAPLQMVIGDICVLPDPATARVPDGCPFMEYWPGVDCGGNMDIRDVATGHTLCLRAQREGGQLVLGDLHAIQGDAEIAGMGAECAGEAWLRVTRDERYRSDRPLIAKKRSFVCVAQRRTFAESRDLATEDAVQVFRRLQDCTEGEARLYVTTVGHLRFGAYAYCVGKSEPAWYKTAPVMLAVEVPLWDNVREPGVGL